MTRRHRWTRPLLVVLAISLAGCGNGDDGDDGAERDHGATRTAGESDTATPVPGGTLTFGLEGETTGGFCPPEAQLAAAGINVHNAVFDPLTAFDAELDPAPWLAESVTPNTDFTAYDVRLRSGITFHDGSPLDARIVKLNLDVYRGEAAAVAATGRRPLLSPIVFSSIASVDVVDDLTVRVTMRQPWPAFPTFLATGRFGIVAEAQLTSPDCAEQLIGTGPFRRVSWERGQEMVLERNPDYWQRDGEGRQLPYLDRLVLRPIESTAGRYQALEGGSIDASHWSTFRFLDQLERDADRFVRVMERPGHREVGHLMLNVGRPPLDDPAVREHLAMALDRDALNEVGNQGGFEPADQPFDSEVMGYREDAPAPVHDPETAAQFFAGKGIKVVVTTGVDPYAKAISDDLQRQLNAVGVEVEQVPGDQSTIINRFLSGDFDLAISRNFPGQDPDSNYVWWYSAFPTNFGRIDDPELDAALDDGRANPDPDARRAAYEEVGRILTDRRYFLWNWYNDWGVGMTPNVHQLGYYAMPDGSDGAGLTWGWTYWTHVWVEQ